MLNHHVPPLTHNPPETTPRHLAHSTHEDVLGAIVIVSIIALAVLGWLVPNLVVLSFMVLVGFILVGLVLLDDHIHGRRHPGIDSHIRNLLSPARARRSDDGTGAQLDANY